MKRGAKVLKESAQSNLSAFVVNKKPKIVSEPHIVLPESGSFEELIHSSWKTELSKDLSSEYFKKLEEFVNGRRKTKTVFPVAKDVFSWSHYCPLNSVKVVILGQDPYHDDGQAHGLCFSVRKGVKKPPSLVNIFKEMKNDYPNFKEPSHGELTNWAKQGVLLLNAVLTVEAHSANSHQKQGWEKFTDAVVKVVNEKCKNVVYLLWGKPAQKKASFVDATNNLILESAHPSPLSASRGFLGCGHFKCANEYLKKHNKGEIDWMKLD